MFRLVDLLQTVVDSRLFTVLSVNVKLNLCAI